MSSERPTISSLLNDRSSAEPRFVRLHGADFDTADLLSETLDMASRIVKLIPEAILLQKNPAAWPLRETASKWDSICAYPEMLRGVDAELLKILLKIASKQSYHFDVAISPGLETKLHLTCSIATITHGTGVSFEGRNWPFLCRASIHVAYSELLSDVSIAACRSNRSVLRSKRFFDDQRVARLASSDGR
nr:hypothetical protein CFP56_72126 [Quercus suber]